MACPRPALLNNVASLDTGQLSRQQLTDVIWHLRQLGFAADQIYRADCHSHPRPSPPPAYDVDCQEERLFRDFIDLFWPDGYVTPTPQLARATWDTDQYETGALKLALQAAKAYGTRYAAAIAEAERVLAQVEAVWQLNAAVKKGDAGKLKEVMERAVAAGVEEHFLGPARLLLEQADARTALSNAIKSKDPAELEAAMVAARSCGVDRARIARAEQTLMQLSSTKESRETASGNLRRTDTGLNNRTTDTQIIRQAVVAGSRR
ncbi:unnamed protein product [Prorocentrum cordatum]|uniref:Uncharacterized protein n=1 Tax=Prorocentrum cordatum TaxID=2364126 RepID=A0ABN9QL13_9DINO|nr:unnamed protein product [Polarella glacialis]